MHTADDWKQGEKIIGACMNCADFINLERTVGELDRAGIDLYHLDIMDGSFVPNIALGPQDVSAIRRLTDNVCDVHLMVREAARYIDLFVGLGAQIIHVHGEEDSQVTRTLQHIRDMGAKSSLAISPCTSFSTAKEALNVADFVLVMRVNPGFSGQTALPFVDRKIDELAAAKDYYGYKILVDGGVSFEDVPVLWEKGVDGFCLGNAGLFGKDSSYQEIVRSLHEQ
ncbi:ribulose-phosphate 3-epimerase [Olsenella sp. HMSC062G07]|uniref:ribulose-phosphate 3-epimerase n=1 Tax=Olsenella sp. HMSC062G07 TaxID=1739330 RepID=UPI0008A655C6|nr:ribulose-phosphate 3-epimerase [Olsenella sp. HMSC062G07]OFK23418.1 hypothetical protein HMPREF2826_04875 [Olsenella sp. HMSC062G07]